MRLRKSAEPLCWCVCVCCVLVFRLSIFLAVPADAFWKELSTHTYVDYIADADVSMASILKYMNSERVVTHDGFYCTMRHVRQMMGIDTVVSSCLLCSTDSSVPKNCDTSCLLGGYYIVLRIE